MSFRKLKQAMPAYNFRPCFIEPIRAGKKTQTIRPVGKRRHAKPGDRLQLYTGMRTKCCAKILDVDPVCLFVLPVRLDFSRPDCPIVVVDQRELPRNEAIEFARRDGFQSLDEMAVMFTGIYGPSGSEMIAINWGA